MGSLLSTIHFQRKREMRGTTIFHSKQLLDNSIEWAQDTRIYQTMKGFMDFVSHGCKMLVGANLGGTLAHTHTSLQQGIPSLPTEVKTRIMEELLGDSVSMMCFALTSRQNYAIYQHVQGPLLSCKLDLACQVSACGRWEQFGLYHCGPMEGDDIVWQRSLSERLLGELSLWHGLKRCAGCLKYKIQPAFEKSHFDGKILSKHESRMQELGYSTSAYWGDHEQYCRRCRWKWGLLELEGGEEVYANDNNYWQGPGPSIGLKVQQEEVETSTKLYRADLTTESMYTEVYERAEDGRFMKTSESYEAWEDIFDAIESSEL